MNEKQKEQFRKGEEIKRQAMRELNLSPSQQALFNSQRVFAMPQSELTGMDDPGFDSPGLTTNTADGVNVYIADKFPMVPNLRHSDYSHLPAWITEKDVIPHEMGHVRDLLNTGETSEPTAIDFEDLVKSSGFDAIPTKNTSASRKFGQVIKSETVPHGVKGDRFGGNRHFIPERGSRLGQGTVFDEVDSDRYYPKVNNRRY